MQRASSSAGLGKADSADASLEALLAELSSASATAAAALAPFKSSSIAQQSAESDLHASAADDKAAAQSPFASSLPQFAFASSSLQPFFASSPQQLPSSSSSQRPSVTLAVPPALLTSADLTVDNVSQLQISHHSVLEAAAASSASSLSPRSSSPQLVAAQSPLSLPPGSSSPLENSHPGSQFVDKLQNEFKQFMAAFDDDLSFIQEVQTHRTLAAGMNPNVELRTLHKRFNNWKFDFKVSVTCIIFEPCCAVLCCAVLCCAVLCCAVLCCAVLCCAEKNKSLRC